jgi:hypothetical protein
MFGSQILDVAIGLIMFYLLLSLACTATSEMIEARIRKRAVMLRDGISEMVGRDRDLLKKVYDHPLVAGLYQGDFNDGNSSELPSYIPARIFSLAAFDIVTRKDAASADGWRSYISMTDARAAAVENRPAAGARTLHDAVITSIDAAQYDFNAAITNLQAWYDGAMDRVSGRFKRHAQQKVLLFAIIITLGVNANTVTVARYLYRDASARAALVNRAGAFTNQTALEQPDFNAVMQQIDNLKLPIGWSDARVLNNKRPLPVNQWTWAAAFGAAGYLLWSIPGWLITVLALTLGAPFWFDALNKLMVIRSTVKPHEKSPEEGSEDRRSKGVAPAPAAGWPQAPVGGGAISQGDVPSMDTPEGPVGELHGNSVT